jgi:hypothetical protein
MEVAWEEQPALTVYWNTAFVWADIYSEI